MSQPKNQVLLAIDTGSARMGLAIYRPDSQLISPLSVLHRKSLAKDLEHLRGVIEREGIEALVVGVPEQISPRAKSPSRQNAEFWIQKLGEVFKLPVYTQDESLSSQEAMKRAQKKNEAIDSLAAAVILEDFIREQA